MKKILKVIVRIVLNCLPLIKFPMINIYLFNKLGYNVSYRARIYSSCQLMGDVEICIGEGTYIGHETLITGGKGKILIGQNCDISDRVNIFCGTHKIDVIGFRTAGEGYGKDIIIEDGVWIGLGALILPGVNIGKKSIVAAGTVVNKNVPPYSVVGGNPMKIIRDLRE